MIPRHVLAQIVRHAAAIYPAECCGLLLADRAGSLRFRAIANVAGTAEGAASARSQRDGYVMDPKALLQALEEADREGGSLWGIVHSHPDVGAYFSREDKDKALWDGEPVWPGARYLVVSVRAGRADGARIYSWDARSRDFLEEDVAGIAELS